MTKYDWKNVFRGPTLLPVPNTTRITIEIWDDSLDWFQKQVERNCGGDWGDLVRHALREYVENHPDGLDDEMRAVLRAPREVNPKYVAWMKRIERLRAAMGKPARARRARSSEKKTRAR